MENSNQGLFNLKDRFESIIKDEQQVCDNFKSDIITKLNFDESINVDIQGLVNSLVKSQERFHSNQRRLDHINYEIELDIAEK